METNAMIDSPRSLGLVRTMRAMPVALLLAAGSAAAAEEQTINAFSVWNGDGSVYESGPHLGTFVGSISGKLFVHTAKVRHPGRSRVGHTGTESWREGGCRC